jgi:hypothetical protein
MHSELPIWLTLPIWMLILFSLWRYSTKEFRRLESIYPPRVGEKILRCGFFSTLNYGSLWSWFLPRYWTNHGMIRVGVSDNGMELKQVFGLNRTFVPWSETIAREDNLYVHIGFVQAPEIDVQLNKIVLTKMQQCLGRPVPFGHVD